MNKSDYKPINCKTFNRLQRKMATDKPIPFEKTIRHKNNQLNNNHQSRLLSICLLLSLLAMLFFLLIQLTN